MKSCNLQSEVAMQDESTPLQYMLFRTVAKQSNGRDLYQVLRD
jgi:hypothetical protein